MRILCSKTFDTVVRLYQGGKIEVVLPNSAMGWIPLTMPPPTIERFVDGFYITFNRDGFKHPPDTGGDLKHDTSSSSIMLQMLQSGK